MNIYKPTCFRCGQNPRWCSCDDSCINCGQELKKCQCLSSKPEPEAPPGLLESARKLSSPLDLTPQGIIMRDWFAGKALAGIMAGRPDNIQIAAYQVAKVAYEIADAMIEVSETYKEGKSG